MRALTAHFTQTLESAALPSPQVEEGTVYLFRPGRMRWEYARPPGKLAIADGSRSWLFLPEDRQALFSALPDARRDQGVALLLQPRIDVLAEFVAAWGTSREAGKAPPLILRPRGADATYDHLGIEADASGFPVRLTVYDALGGSVRYEFIDLRFSDRLDEGLFKFVPPPGVEIQEITEPAGRAMASRASLQCDKAEC